jgi:uncharacterized membrane protein YbhN (UPF0104 family)
MSVDERRSAEERDLEQEEVDAELELSEEEDAQVSGLQSLLQDRRKLATGFAVFLIAIVGIYVLFPKIVGFDDALARIDSAKWYWLLVAIAFNIAAFGAYVALFRGILGGTSRRDDRLQRRLDWRASYQITMAGLAASRIFSAGGAGGIVLTYWALRKAGMPRRRAACRMVAFLVLMYAVYPTALILFGVLLRTHVLGGPAPVAGTIVPAAIAAGLIVLATAVSLIPDDLERRLSDLANRPGTARWGGRLATVPATLGTGTRTAWDYIRHPSRGALGVLGALGFWAANIGILWASFEAFGGHVAFAVLVQGFFIGMAANLIPSPAGGVGSVDAGMIAAFALFDVPGSLIFPAVLTYRIVAFWLPVPPGIVAYFQLRRTVSGWDAEREQEGRQDGYTSESKVRAAEAT